VPKKAHLGEVGQKRNYSVEFSRELYSISYKVYYVNFRKSLDGFVA